MYEANSKVTQVDIQRKASQEISSVHSACSNIKVKCSSRSERMCVIRNVNLSSLGSLPHVQAELRKWI